MDQTPPRDHSPAELAAKHMPLVRILAARLYRMRWDDSVPFDDYFQMGAVGLLEAAQRYDPARGAAFPTFASWRITGAILNGLEQATEVHQQRSARKRLVAERGASLAGEGAQGEACDDGLDAVVSRLAAAAVGLAIGFMLEGTSLYSDGAEATHQDGYAGLAFRQMAQKLRASLGRLPEPERTVVEGHYFHHQAFVDLAAQMSLSKGRVSQLHRSAIGRLRAMLGREMIEFEG